MATDIALDRRADVGTRPARAIDAAELSQPLGYRRMVQAIRQVTRVDELANSLDKIAAIQAYAAQSENLELERNCRKIRLRANQRMGELLAEVNGQGARVDTGNTSKVTQRQVAEAAGLSKHQLVTARRISNVPHKQFEKAVESESPPSVTAMAELGTKPRENGLGPNSHVKAQSALAALRKCATALDAVAPKHVLDEGSAEAAELVERISGWCARFHKLAEAAA